MCIYFLCKLRRASTFSFTSIHPSIHDLVLPGSRWDIFSPHASKSGNPGRSPYLWQVGGRSLWLAKHEVKRNTYIWTTQLFRILNSMVATNITRVFIILYFATNKIIYLVYVCSFRILGGIFKKCNYTVILVYL